jgi:hypothetical protein
MKVFNLTRRIKGLMEGLYRQRGSLKEVWTLYRGDIFSTSDVKQVILRDLDRFELVNGGI